ncbi:DUF2459 domain-containing protein [Roseicella aquatilis]|nr:DUF2459 domain-containing protein [Roseicella aquatilis]
MTIAAAPGRRKAMALLAFGALGACARPPPAAPCVAPPPGEVAWLLERGWHLEIALRRADLVAPLTGIAARFPGAETLLFGFGKRSYVLAEAGAVEELLLGPLPGRGAVEVRALSAEVAALPGPAVALPLPPGGQARLQAFIAGSILWDGAEPRPAHPRPVQDSLFYEARRGYSLLYTCNTWTAEALRAAGLPVSAQGVVLAGAVLAQLPRVAGGCVLGPALRR